MKIVPYNAGLQKVALYFASGNIYLDNFLKNPEVLDDGIGKTYVLVTEYESKIIGYYNIGTGYIARVDINSPVFRHNSYNIQKHLQTTVLRSKINQGSYKTFNV